MTNSEARDLMAQNSHDVTILDGEQADAINLVNIRNNGEVIIGDNDNQIMVLESSQKSSGMSMDGIEILEDKDIRILDGKSLDDRFVDGMTFLSQTKIDDLLLGPKSLSIDGDSALADDGRWIGAVMIYKNSLDVQDHFLKYESDFNLKLFYNLSIANNEKIQVNIRRKKMYANLQPHSKSLETLEIGPKTVVCS